MKYRAIVKVFQDGKRQVILQKSLLGIIWFDMYAKTGKYSKSTETIDIEYPYVYEPVIVKDCETARKIFVWITESNNHTIFIDEYDNVIFGLSKKDKFLYHTATNLNDIKRIYPRNTNLGHIHKLKYNKSNKKLYFI